MSEPFLSSVSVFAFGYAPKGWALCQGQLLPIKQYQALFSLLGTTSGGDGRTNFGLPDMRSRVPISFGGSYTLGQKAGEETHTLGTPEMPSHNHGLKAQPQPAAATNNSESATSTAALSSGWYRPHAGTATKFNYYSTSAVNVALSNGGAPGQAVGNSGGQPHPNLMPYLALNFCIALVGIFPSPN